MKKLTVLVAASLVAAAFASPVEAASKKTKNSVVHSNTHAHYKGKDHMFRHHGDHDNYNPHHRKCGHMPSGSC